MERDGERWRGGGGEGWPPALCSVTAPLLFCAKVAKVLHRTAGPSQTAPPGPRGGRYDGDERLGAPAVRQTDGRVTEGEDAARWGGARGMRAEEEAECAELRSGNHRLFRCWWGEGLEIVSLRSGIAGSADFQSDG